MKSTLAFLFIFAVAVNAASLHPQISPRIYGINLGGWFVLERFINPSMFEAADDPRVVDEYTWAQYLHDDEEKNQLLHDHWATWFTEEDAQKIADIGFTHVRLPVNYWMWLTREEMTANDEYFSNEQIPYLLDGLRWLQERDVKVILDLHTAPGSQNGWDNSGRETTTPSWGTGNTIDRTLLVLDRMSEFIKSLEDDPTTSEVVVGINVLNEPFPFVLPGGIEVVKDFYTAAYPVVRAHLEPERYMFVIDHAFVNTEFPGFMQEEIYENVILDVHIYHCFDPGLREADFSTHLGLSCGDFALNMERQTLPVFVGEWSVAWKVDSGVAHYEPFPSECEQEFMKVFLRTQMQVYDSFFFWTWKTDWAPMWDYQLGYDNDWYPSFPLEEEDMCLDTTFTCGDFSTVPEERTSITGGGGDTGETLATETSSTQTGNSSTQIESTSSVTATETENGTVELTEDTEVTEEPIDFTPSSSTPLNVGVAVVGLLFVSLLF